MARAHIRAKMSLDNSNFRNGLTNSKSSVSSLAKTLGPLKGAIAGAFAVTAIRRFTRQAMQAADALDNLSRATGVNTTSLQALGVIARESGLGMGGLQSALSRVERVIAEAASGSQPMIDVLDRLSLSAEELSGLDADRQLEAIARALDNNGNAAESTALKYQIFGRQARQINGLLQDLGQDGLDATIKKYQELGLIIDETSLRILDLSEQTLSRAQTRISNFGSVALASLINGFLDIRDATADLVDLDIDRRLERAARQRARYGELTSEEWGERWLQEDAEREAEQAAKEVQARDAERKARLEDLARTQEEMHIAAERLMLRQRDIAFNSMSDEAQARELQWRLTQEQARLAEQTGIDAIHTQERILDLEERIAGVKERMAREQERVDRDRQRAQEVQARDAEREAQAQAQAIEAQAQARERIRKDILGIASGETVQAQAPQAANDLQRIGLFVGGASDPLQQRMDRQIAIQREMLRYLKSISEQDNNLIGRWG